MGTLVTKPVKVKLADWDIETLQLVAGGNTTIETAKLLQVSPHAIKSRLKSAAAILNTCCTEHSIAVACVRDLLTVTAPEEPSPALERDLLDVLVLIARGKTRDQMAKILNVPIRTVKIRIRELYRQLPATNSCSLVYQGFQTGNLVKRKPEEKKWTTKSPPPESGDGSVPLSASCS